MKNKTFVSAIFNSKPKLVRNDRMADRDYMVIPMVMLTEGVHAGSAGAYLYTPEEIGKRVELWNMKPVVVYHPDSPSACTPDVLSNRQIGVIMNTKWDTKNKRLKAEAWLEADRVKKVDNRVQDAIDNEEVLELSTGLFADSDETEGEWNGESYKGTLFNFGPDHLAILPDQIGACSVADGAGFYLNQEGEIFNKIRKEAGKWFVFSEEGKKLSKGYDTKGEAEDRLREIEYFKTHKNVLKNEISVNLLRDQLSKLINTGVKEGYRFIEDIFDNYFIWSDSVGLYKREYEVDKDDKVTIKGIDIPVVRKVEYEPVKNKEHMNMDKKEMVDNLIAKGIWNETDRERLMKLDDDVLQKMIPTPPTDQKVQNKEDVKPPMTITNETKETPTDKVKTLDEYLAEMPPALRSTVKNAMAMEQQEKERLIVVITSNKKNKFTVDWLKTQDMEMLKNLALLAIEEKKEEDKEGINWGMNLTPVTNKDSVPVLDVPVQKAEKK